MFALFENIDNIFIDIYSFLPVKRSKPFVMDI